MKHQLDLEDDLNDLGLESEGGLGSGDNNGRTVHWESPSKNSNMSEEERFQMALKQINQLETELADFQQSSYELEQELEKELNALEDKNEKLEDKIAAKQKDIENWKAKYVELEAEFNNLNSKNEDKFKNYKKELQSVRSKLVNIEILNDNIEQNERILSINLNDLESKYNDSLEKIALIESELNYKDELLLKEKLNHQNTKNQLSELQAELDKYKPHSDNEQEVSQHDDTSRHASIAGSVGSMALSELSKKLPKSNSMKQLHNMIEQTKFMENRVESIRNTIRPSKMRKVSGRTISAQPVESEDSFAADVSNGEYDITQASADNTNTIANTTTSSASTYFSALSKSTTNDSLNHSKAKNRRKKLNLQKPPIQPLNLKEFKTHFTQRKETPVSTMKMVSGPAITSSSQVTARRSSGTYRLNDLETIKGSPNGGGNGHNGKIKGIESKRLGSSAKAAEVKKLFNSPKGKTRRKGGLLPSLRKFNINERE